MTEGGTGSDGLSRSEAATPAPGQGARADVDGNGRADHADVVWLFNNL